jgi:hypothetical protein
VVAAALLAAPLGAAAAGAVAHSQPAPQGAHAPLLVGIANQHFSMFRAPLWRQLHTPISRYNVPYDAANYINELNEARTWVGNAIANGQKVLVAFYHSYQTPLRNPSPQVYRRDVAKFLRLLPEVHEYQPWNEVTRGLKPGVFTSPDAFQSAIYYREMRSLAPHDTIVGLDMLDQPDVQGTLDYLAEFKQALRQLHIPMPQLWGLHNYSDVNRLESSRTRAILRAVPGTLWITETGGIVRFGPNLPNYHGSGLRRAARDLRYMFALAHINSRIKRLYIYDWNAAPPSEVFDAGLTDLSGKPRPGYVVVCNHLLHNSPKCRVHVSNH